jgi:Flp pilus assembly protein CpaB
MFAMTLALLAGLGSVVAARYAGWLGKVEPPREKEKEVQVLVAARNIFPGDLIDASYVRTRPLKPEEKSDYQQKQDDFLPAQPQAASLRVANKAIEADAPIRRRDLNDLKKPEPLNQRLLPNMRAVTSISTGSGETTRTAPLALNLRVIAKRNALWTVFAGLPENKAVNFTLEANSYRSALIEFGKTKGTLTLAPVSSAEQKALEERRERLLAGKDPKMLPVSFARAADKEVSAEEERVEQFVKGEYSVGTQDLIRIFDLQTSPPPQSPVVIEYFSGLQRTAIVRFSGEGEYQGVEDPRRMRPTAAQKAKPQAPTISFNAPGCGSKPGRKPGST